MDTPTPKPGGYRTTTSSTVRGRVILVRHSRIAVVALRTSNHDEFDVDVPLLFLPKGVGDGAELEITICARGAES